MHLHPRSAAPDELAAATGRIPPRPFSAGRDLPFVVALVAAGAALGAGIATSARGPAVVLLATFALIAGLSWSQELVQSWAIGDDWIAVRRWARWKRLGVDDIRSVELDEDDPFGQTLVFSGPGMRAVPLPVDRGRTQPAFGPALSALLEACQRRGTTGPGVEAAISLPPRP